MISEENKDLNTLVKDLLQKVNGFQRECQYRKDADDTDTDLHRADVKEKRLLVNGKTFIFYFSMKSVKIATTKKILEQRLKLEEF